MTTKSNKWTQQENQVVRDWMMHNHGCKKYPWKQEFKQKLKGLLKHRNAHAITVHWNFKLLPNMKQHKKEIPSPKQISTSSQAIQKDKKGKDQLLKDYRNLNDKYKNLISEAKKTYKETKAKLITQMTEESKWIKMALGSISLQDSFDQ